MTKGEMLVGIIGGAAIVTAGFVWMHLLRLTVSWLGN